MKKNAMVDLLQNCFWDGMSLGEATLFIKRCYQEAPKDEHIKNACHIIKECTGVEWK